MLDFHVDLIISAVPSKALPHNLIAVEMELGYMFRALEKGESYRCLVRKMLDDEFNE